MPLQNCFFLLGGADGSWRTVFSLPPQLEGPSLRKLSRSEGWGSPRYSGWKGEGSHGGPASWRAVGALQGVRRRVRACALGPTPPAVGIQGSSWLLICAQYPAWACWQGPRSAPLPITERGAAGGTQKGQRDAPVRVPVLTAGPHGVCRAGTAGPRSPRQLDHGHR